MTSTSPATTQWAALVGTWRLSGTEATYTGPEQPGVAKPHGLAISSVPLRSGCLRASVTLASRENAAGHLVFGYDAASEAYFGAGVGSYGRAYCINSYALGVGWRAVAAAGAASNLAEHEPLHIEVRILGQRVVLLVGGVRVLETALPHPLSGDQVGLFAWGAEHVDFKGFEASAQLPRAFVVMKFDEPYNSFYEHVIRPVAQELGFAAVRADDVYRPGIILQDIITQIEESDVIIAEITPENANVFYELGYAHAMGKPTIILAEKGRPLPFDVSGYRCIFYENSIRGKAGVEEQLRRHLKGLMNGSA